MFGYVFRIVFENTKIIILIFSKNRSLNMFFNLMFFVLRKKKQNYREPNPCFMCLTEDEVNI